MFETGSERRVLMTPEEMYELLSPENREIVKHQIEILIASQSGHQSSVGFPA